MHAVEWYAERRKAFPLNSKDKAIIEREYKEITGRDFARQFPRKCDNCYQDAIIIIMLAMKKTDNGGYVLRGGVVFRYKGQIINNSNITPEAARYYISQDLARRGDFESLGDDYDSFETPKNKD